MILGFDIKHILRRENIKTFLSLCLVLLLCACGDSEEPEVACDTIQSHITAGTTGGEAPCVLCGFFATLTEVGITLANASWNRLAGGLAKFIVIIVAIQIAFLSLRMVGSFGKQTVSDFLTSEKNGILFLVFKAAFIWFLLAHEQNIILKYFIVPLLDSGMRISSMLQGSFLVGDTPNYNNWETIFNLLLEAANNFNQSIYSVVAIGETLSCYASVGSLFDWHFMQLFDGMMLFAFGWVLLIGGMFYLIDVTIRLTFAAILLPIGIACAIAKLSVVYTKNIWKLFVNVFFSMVMLGLILGLILKVIYFCLGVEDSVHMSDVAISQAAQLYKSSTGGPFQALIDSNDITRIALYLDSFEHLLLIVICFAILINLISGLNSLVEDISDTSSISQPASAQFAGIAQNAINEAKKPAKWVGDVAKQGGKQIGHDLARATRLDKLYKWTGNRATAMRGNLTGTGREGYKAFWRKENLNKNIFLRGGKATFRGIKNLRNRLGI